MPRRIALCRAALRLVRRTDNPNLWAALQNELANSLAQTPRGERAENLEKAIEHYSLALQVYTRQADPERWAATQNNLANAYADRIRGERAENLEKAIEHYSAALQVYTAETWPDRARTTARSLAGLHFDARRWAQAHEALAIALQATDVLYRQALGEPGQEVELAKAVDLAPRDSYALARLGKLPDAVLSVELGRARMLSTALALDRAALDKAKPEHREDFQTARDHIRTLEAELRAATAGDREAAGYKGRAYLEITADLRAARAGLEAAIAHIRQYLPDFLAKPTFRDVATAAQPGVPLCYLVTTTHGSLALIVPATGSPVPVWADDFTTDDLDALLVQFDEGGNVVGGYLPGQLLVHKWLEASLPKVLSMLGEKLMAPVAQALREMEASGVVLIPGGRLALLPLHAALLPSPDGEEAGPEPFLDLFDVAYAPGARPLRAAQQALTALPERPPVLAGVGNPLPNPKPLAFAQAELEEIEPFFPANEESRRTLYTKEASKEALLQRLPGATHVHLSCHGMFDPVNPLQSHLELSDREPLTLQEVQRGQLVQGARLAVLSACQTAIADFRQLPDEAIGLPAGFLRAGAPGVVGTLWPVNDISTALLMIKFYEYHLGEGERPVRALRRAQRWLRTVTSGELTAYFQRHKALNDARRLAQARMPDWTVTAGLAQFAWDDPQNRPFADKPYHWAPFIFVGV